MRIDINSECFTPAKLAKDTLFNSSVAIDWGAWFNRCIDEESPEFEIAYPAISESILSDYWPDWQAWQDENPLSHFDGCESDRLEAAAEAFEYSDSWHEWRDSYVPAMNFAWPIRLRAGADPAELAARLDAMAGCVTLVRIDESDYLALTGGGMDLSWNLCAAYIACECMPPLRLLRDLPAMASDGRYCSNLLDDVAALVMACLPVAAECMEAQAGFLRRDVDRLQNKESGK